MLAMQVTKLIERIYLCQFLGRSPVSWHSKKQNSAIMSTAEAEYIVARACCAQILSSANSPETLDWTTRRFLSSMATKVPSTSLRILFST